MVRTVVAAGGVVIALGLGAGALTGGVTARGPAGSVTLGPAATSPAVPGARDPVATGHRAAPLDAPVDAPVVVARGFDGPATPWAAGHRGVDLAAHVGQVVRAPGSGVVTFAGTVVDRGVVTVTHDDGLRSSLEPVDPSARAGQRVLRGQPVGSVAAVSGHCAPATCLHWGLRRGEEYLDPMRHVHDRAPVVLLPSG